MVIIEVVRPGMAAHTLAPCYIRTGVGWLGRRTRRRRGLGPVLHLSPWQDGAMKLRIFTEPQQGADYQTLRAVALATEELGFDAFFRSDHYLAMGGSGLPGPTDSWVTLGALAVETSRVRLGTMVTAATFRLPGPLAISVAQVDQMSGGRVELGLGSGWFDASTPPTAYRSRLSVSASTAWRSSSPSSPACGRPRTARRSPSTGRTTSWRTRPRCRSRPSGRARRSSWRCGRAPHAAAGARYADEYNVPFRPVADTAAAFGRVREACQAAGRDPSSVIYSVAQTVCCGKDEAEFRRRAAAIGWEPAGLRETGVGGTPG
jgi:alkanesulfonate monooxygenase SsuD/methylene tetrahydromethanopterin reductase-like flavin-dependent oxidoreductase (luciferase family)